MNSLDDKIDRALFEKDDLELALGYLRFEALRKLNPGQFARLYDSALRRDIPFDTLVDDLITKQP